MVVGVQEISVKNTFTVSGKREAADTKVLDL